MASQLSVTSPPMKTGCATRSDEKRQSSGTSVRRVLRSGCRVPRESVPFPPASTAESTKRLVKWAQRLDVDGMEGEMKQKRSADDAEREKLKKTTGEGEL